MAVRAAVLLASTALFAALLSGCAPKPYPFHMRWEEEYPYSLGDRLQKHVRLPFAFEDVWEASLEELREVEAETRKEQEVLGSRIETCRDSGLMTYTVTTKHRNLKTYSAHNILVVPVDGHSTELYYGLYQRGSYNVVTFANFSRLFPEEYIKRIENRLSERGK